MQKLSIVTVVYNDWPGLEATLASLAPHRGASVEHWIIDGSSDGAVRERREQIEEAGSLVVSEPDEGLYDAMNKGLARATGALVTFLNAGDTLHDSFDPARLWEVANQHEGRVILGYSIEEWGADRYLRPGSSFEHRALEMPAHQATFYPLTFCKQNKYRLDRPLGADGVFTAEAVRTCGAVFAPMVVCSFALGGRSTRYDLRTVRARIMEYKNGRDRLKTVLKFAFWILLPRSVFYRSLALSKFTRLKPGEKPRARHDVLRLADPAGASENSGPARDA